ncbi:hypothetical protein VP01_1906g1, partial [Puccinia sorghi]
RLKKIQQLIDQTIKLENCYHDKIRSRKKAYSTPSTLKNEDTSKNKKFPSKPSIPSASRPKKPTEIASVLNKEGQFNSEEHARREKEELFLYCASKLEKKIEDSSLETCKESYQLSPFPQVML